MANLEMIQYHPTTIETPAETAATEISGCISAESAAAAELAIVKSQLLDKNEGKSVIRQIQTIMDNAMGIARDRGGLSEGLAKFSALQAGNATEKDLLDLGRAMIFSALAGEESRGAHYRTDHPERNDAVFQQITVVQKTDAEISLQFVESGKEFL